MQTEGERIARLEERYAELHRMIGDLVTEEGRTRQRLHDLEGAARAIHLEAKADRRRQAERDRRYGRRMQALTVAVMLAAVIVPLVTAYLHKT